MADFVKSLTPEGTDMKLFSFRIASSPAFYIEPYQKIQIPIQQRLGPRRRTASNTMILSTQANRMPLLRPGIMLSSSIRTVVKNGKSEEVFKTTTSGILVTDRNGHLFITVAMHGFEEDGVIYHPNPHKGSVIGQKIETFPGTDISIARLNPGLRYINETFGTQAAPDGVLLNGISSAYTMHLQVYNNLTMNNPFSGSCEGGYDSPKRKDTWGKKKKGKKSWHKN